MEGKEREHEENQKFKENHPDFYHVHDSREGVVRSVDRITSQ